MCPSYMATRDESDSTRGRANVLRLAMSGRLGETGLGDEGVKQVTGAVPRVPRVQGRVSGRRGRGPLQERISGRLLVQARCACARADPWPHSRDIPLGQPLRARRQLAITQCSHRVDERTALRPRSPARAASLDGRYVRQAIRGTSSAPQRPDRRAGTPALFNDTFTNYYNPAVGMAGTHACSKRRVWMSRSLRSAAADARSSRRASSTKHAARRPRRPTRSTSDRLGAAGRSSSSSRAACRRSARDIPSLLRGDAQQKARRVRRSLASCSRIWSSGRHRPDAPRCRSRQGPKTILLHGHCHQKAMGLLPPARSLSRAFPDRRWSISMPDAAAWPDRLATCAITSTCRKPSANGVSCRLPAASTGLGARRERRVLPPSG